MFRQVRSRSPQSRRALPAGADRRLRSALKSMIGFKPSAVEMYAFTSSAGLRRRIRTGPVVPFETLDTPTDAPPAPKWASFTGGDGQFNGLVSRPQLLLPLRVLDSIIYQVDLASDSTFDTNLETVSEGQTRTFNKGGFSTVNRYARVRAKFPTSDWTGWIAFGLPTAVASGTVPTDLSDLTGDLDDIPDGTVSVKINAGAATSGDIDLGKAGVVGAVAEAKIGAAAIAIAKLKTETVNRIFASSTKKTNVEALESSGVLVAGKFVGGNPGETATRVMIDATVDSGATGWRLIATRTIDVPTTVNSIKFSLNVLTVSSGGGTLQRETIGDNVGFSITSGAGPGTPQVSRNGFGDLPQNNPVTGSGLTLSLYVKTKSSVSDEGCRGVLNVFETVPMSAGEIT